MVRDDHSTARSRTVLNPGSLHPPIIPVEPAEYWPPHVSVERIVAKLIDFVIALDPAAQKFEIARNPGLVGQWQVLIERIDLGCRLRTRAGFGFCFGDYLRHITQPF